MNRTVMVASLLVGLAAVITFFSLSKSEPTLQDSNSTRSESKEKIAPSSDESERHTEAKDFTLPERREISSDVSTPPDARTLRLAQPSSKHWWHNAVIYQVWPRSFYDKNGDGNGDFAGLTEKLGYLNQLGVDAIWLTPMFESPSYHGYDTQDFYRVEEDYGTMASFERFISEAKRKNIKVVLDLVVNHVSEEHTWFKHALASNPEYEDYFVWEQEIPSDYGKAWETKIDPTVVWHTKSEREGYYYGVFGWTQPDLNFRNPKVADEIKKVASFWLDKGVDGFRLDAIRYIVEDGGAEGQADTQGTIDFWADFSAHVRQKNPEALLVGEALADIDKIESYYNKGRGIDGAFDFGFNYIVQSLLEKPDINLDIDDKQKSKSIRNNLWNTFARRSQDSETPSYFYHSFLNNHDHDRLSSTFNNDPKRAKIAAALLLTSPGTAYMYYGEEIGMGQYQAGDDMYRRALMQWDGSENAGFNTTGERWLDNGKWFFWLDNFTPWWKDYWQYPGNRSIFNVEKQLEKEDSILNFYRRLIALRKEDSVLGQAQYMSNYENTGMAWIVKYQKDNELRWVILNLDPDNRSEFTLPEGMTGEYLDVFSKQDISLTTELSLTPAELLILKKKD